MIEVRRNEDLLLDCYDILNILCWGPFDDDAVDKAQTRAFILVKELQKKLRGEGLLDE